MATNAKHGPGAFLASALCVSSVYPLAAVAVDLVHAGAMIVWAIGLPLLVWHRHARLSRAYTYYAIVFVLISVTSQAILGECILTTLARQLWNASNELRADVPFTTLLVNAVAGVRPSSRAAVLLWEVAILVTSVGSLWSWYATHPRRHTRRRVDAQS